MTNEVLSVLSRFNNFIRNLHVCCFHLFSQIFFIFFITNETFLFAKRQIAFVQYSSVIMYNFLYPQQNYKQLNTVGPACRN